MNVKNWWLGCLVGLLFCVGCGANKNVFVLLPDPDGNVGSIEVTNEGGTQVLTGAGDATRVKDPSSAPSEAAPMEEKEIQKNFGAALAAQPDPPARYILYFRHDSTDLTEDSRKKLPEIIETMDSRKSTDISVIGHTDRSGSEEFNLQLSLKRAVKVKNLLLRQGVTAESIEVTSHGEGDPLIPTPDNVIEPRNRRVEVIIR